MEWLNLLQQSHEELYTQKEVGESLSHDVGWWGAFEEVWFLWDFEFCGMSKC